MFDRFDIVAAHYFFCLNYHTGQRSVLYARLCRITERLRFRPAPNWHKPSDVSENCRRIYMDLVSRHNECANYGAMVAQN